MMADGHRRVNRTEHFASMPSLFCQGQVCVIVIQICGCCGKATNKKCLGFSMLSEKEDGWMITALKIF
jgi:hypothetical protein